MDIKFCEDFIFYDSNPDINKPNYPIINSYIGIYKSKNLEQRDKFNQLSLIKKLFNKIPKRNPSILDDVEFIAMANVELNSNLLIVKNVAAVKGYGPTIYAVLFQLAKERGYCGVCPNQDPKKILSKPKEIWRQFSQNYSGQITLKPLKKQTHSESWLNCSYSLTGQNIIDLKSMRSRSEFYFNLLDDNQQLYFNSTLWDMANDLGKASVNAYK